MNGQVIVLKAIIGFTVGAVAAIVMPLLGAPLWSAFLVAFLVGVIVGAA